jgi:hypothetical protein
MRSGLVLKQIVVEHYDICLGVMPNLQEIGDLVNGHLGKVIHDKNTYKGMNIT